MKKQMLIFACLGFITSALAQENNERPNKEQTDKGKWFVQTEVIDFLSNNNTTTTNFDYRGEENWSAGLSGGYFVKKNFAITAALGYANETNINYNVKSFSYKIGAKYYFKNNIFLGADVGGSTLSLTKRRPIIFGPIDPNRFRTGINAGYAWFIGKHLSIEPSIRNEFEFIGDETLLNINLNLGLSIHF